MPAFRLMTALLLLPLSAPANEPDHQAEKIKSLASQLDPLIEAHPGRVAVAIKHLPTGVTFQRDADVVMPTASLIKLPVMIAAYQAEQDGDIDLNTMISLRDGDKVPGSGILTEHFSEGATISVRDAIRLMIMYSDNTATNLVLDQIGLELTGDTMNALGYPETRINSKVYRGSTTTIAPERSSKYGLGSARPGDIVGLLESLHDETLVSKGASQAMLNHLHACDDNTRLGRLLPADVRFAHKTGAISNARCDAGLMLLPGGPVAICVMTAENEDTSWSEANAADKLLANIGQIVANVFGTESKGESGIDRTRLQNGAFGDMVEALQRTLNARLEPSPNLSVDGDFGPATEAAVRRFQRERELDDNGIVSAKTWKALSPVLMRRDPVPHPDVVNAERLPLEEPDASDGVPFVTCKAWGVLDVDSGSMVGSDGPSQRLPIASTTKIMTAYIVLQYAEQHPEVLDETLTFTPRADETRGSTSGVRAGESLSVRECLYGLMLPSGNDASVALAEHFGARLPIDADRVDEPLSEDPLERFIVVMNQTADDLGMVDSRFRNTSGLHDEEHFSSVADLLTVTALAIRDPLFRAIIGTRQRGCTLHSEGGYTRHVVWKNTNRLLKISGYQGVKTGTTTPAGACLVAFMSRDGQNLLLALLGSASSDARYADARNLFRWASNQAKVADPDEK